MAFDDIPEDRFDEHDECKRHIATLERQLAEAQSMKTHWERSFVELLKLKEEARARVAELEAAGTFSEGLEAALEIVKEAPLIEPAAIGPLYGAGWNEAIGYLEQRILAIQRPAPAAAEPRCQMRIINGVVAGIAQCCRSQGHLGVCDFSGTLGEGS